MSDNNTSTNITIDQEALDRIREQNEASRKKYVTVNIIYLILNIALLIWYVLAIGLNSSYDYFIVIFITISLIPNIYFLLA